MSGLSIPTLRTLTISAGTTTIPFGETWVVWDVVTQTPAVNSSVILTISSNSINLIDCYSTGTTHTIWSGAGCPYNAVLKDGDYFTVTGSASIVIYYWIIETDFNIPALTIPALRMTSANTTDESVTNTITVPANQTWIIPWTSVVLWYTKGGSTTTTTFTATISGLGRTLWTSSSAFNISVTSGRCSVSGSIGKGKKIQLNTGDTITSSIAPSDPLSYYSNTIYVFYWILEQDL